MTNRVYNILFLCTGNSARSILAETILNESGKGRFRAFSAGSHPAGAVNRHARDYLKQHGLPAGEMCPTFPALPMSAHWGIEDPVAVEGDDEAKRQAIAKAFRLLHHRISLFTGLPLDKLDQLSLQKHLADIGQLPRVD